MVDATRCRAARKSSLVLAEPLEPRRLLAAGLDSPAWTPLDVNASTNGSDPSEAIEIGNMAFFVAEHDRLSTLWTTDGSVAGTTPFLDAQGRPITMVEQLIRAGTPENEVLFFLRLGTYETQGIWISDGTPEGTRRWSFIDIATTWDWPNLGSANGWVYWSTYDSVYAVDGLGQAADIYREGGGDFYDVSAVSPSLNVVRSGSPFWNGYVVSAHHLPQTSGIRPTENNAAVFSVSNITAAEGIAYFYGFSDDKYSRRLYRYDGESLTPVLEIPDENSWVYETAAASGSLYFTHSTRPNWLQTFDPSSQLMKLNLQTRAQSAIGLDRGLYGVRNLKPFRSGVIFEASEEGAMQTMDLWYVDESGLVKLTGTGSMIGASRPADVFIAGSRAFFSAVDPISGRELYHTDGTQGGTLLMEDLQSGPTGSNPTPLTMQDNGDLVLAVTDQFAGRELFIAEAGAAPLRLVADLETSPQPADPGEALFSGQQVLFTAADGEGYPTRDIWSATTAASPQKRAQPVPLVDSGAQPENLVQFGDTIAYAFDGRLWLKQGDAAPVAVGPSFAAGPEQLLAANGRLFFVAAPVETPGDREVWTSDGSDVGTQRVADIRQGVVGSDASEFVAAGDKVFFIASDGIEGYQLWRTDGTPEGTLRLTGRSNGLDTYDHHVFGADQIAVIGDVVTFIRSPSQGYSKLWMTRGEPEDVRSIDIGTLNPRLIGATGNRLFLVARQPFNGSVDLYTLDLGTSALVKVGYASGAQDLVVSGGHAYLGMSASTSGIGKILGSRGTPGDLVTLWEESALRVMQMYPDGQGLFFAVRSTSTYAPPPTLWYAEPSSAAPVDPAPDERWTFDRLLAADNRRAVVSASTLAGDQEAWLVTGSDMDAPAILHASAGWQLAQTVALDFSEQVTDLSADDLTVRHLSSGLLIDPARFTLQRSPDGSAATWIYDGTLPDGNYRATLPAGSVTDAAGNPLAEDFTLDFHVLAGDTDRDRDVDFFDFLKLRSNYGTSGKLFSDGDFDYDTDVDFFDFLILRGNYGVTLPPPSGSGSLFDDGDESGGL